MIQAEDEESGEDFSKDVDAVEPGDDSEVEPEDTPKKKAPAKKPVSKKGKKAAEKVHAYPDLLQRPLTISPG